MKKLALVAVLALLVAVMSPLPASAETGPGDASNRLREAVTVEGVRAHQAALQAVADANGGTRAAASPGYDASVDYVVAQLTGAGYNVEVQDFDFDFFEEIGDQSFAQATPVAKDYVAQTDFDVMRFSGSGSTGTVAITAVDLSLDDRDASTSGCEVDDFAGFAAGTIALMQRGACSFAQKATNAEAAGAVGVIIFNQGNTPEREALLLGRLGGPGSAIPVVGASFAVGEELAVDATGSLETNTVSEVRSTKNVIAQSVNGDPDSVVMAGAHLDSVPEGPGIQDNGSGSSAILEIALQLADEFGVNEPGNTELVNSVRFGWWGAEEFGLIGSTDYVLGLSDEELAKIMVYQNYDMIGSPNFVRFVYDSDGSDIAPEILVVPESAALEQTFLDHFARQGLANEPTVVGQRSDHFAFCASGIPCGGLFTGAEGLKTAAQVAIYGGTEGEQYDPCYHDVCDTFDNISLTALDQMSDAAAHAVATYAFSHLCNRIPATLVGSNRADTINGTIGDDVIVTLGGKDKVNGRGGNDTICLGAGADVANGGAGNDLILGGAGADDIKGGAGDDVVDGGAGADYITGNAGADQLSGGAGKDDIKGGSGVDTISGDAGADKISGGADNDVIDGGDGRDEIRGNGGADNASGGAGADEIFGNGGDDVLDGGAGRDSLKGGAGTDACLNGETLQSCETTFVPPTVQALLLARPTIPAVNVHPEVSI